MERRLAHPFRGTQLDQTKEILASKESTEHPICGLTAIGDGTELVHEKRLSNPGLFRILEPLVRTPLFSRLVARLEEIKRHLEEER